jgi:hypothetical protein
MFGARKAPKLALLLLLAGVAAAVWQRRKAIPAAQPAAPSWPPLDPQPAPRPFVATTPAPAPAPTATAHDAAPAAETATDDEPAADQRWVAPVDGQCPDGYPVKANDNSGIFHVPGGRFYARTVPERCYATAEDAAADGYRRAKA